MTAQRIHLNEVTFVSQILQVNIEDLLRCQGVESARVEFKASWDENTTGYQILKTLCAYANDFQNLNGGYIEDDLYVFVVDLRDGRFKAHGVSPRLIDSDGLALTDPGGKPIIRQMIEALKDSDRGELDYAWRNPVTRKVEDKHTRFRKVGDLLVAVGYYTR